MHQPRTLFYHAATLALFVQFTLTSVLWGATQRFDLKDHLNREWTGEYVSYDVSFPNKACHEESTSLADDAGKPVAHQLSDRQYWPNSKFIKKATLSFVVDQLPALGHRSYVLTHGAASVEGNVSQDKLKVAEQDQAWELLTPSFGIRVARGSAKFDTPVPIKDVPSPVSAIRLTDGSWMGSAVFSGPAKVKAWEAKLVEQGPVFAEVHATYSLLDGNTLTYTVKLVSGDYAARITSHSTADLVDTQLSFNLGAGVSLSDAVLIPGLGQYAREIVTELKPEALFYLNSWPGDGWFKDSPSALTIRLKGRDEQLQLNVVDAGAWVAPQELPEWADFQPWDYDQIPVMWHGWQSKRIPFNATAGGGLVMKINAAQGWRKWMLGVSTQPDLLLKRFKGQHMSVHSPLPRLNQVKDMVLSWKSSRREHPWLMVNGQRALKNAGTYNQDAFRSATNVDSLRKQLDSLGTFDAMRSPKPLAYLYDACYELVDPAEREIFKAQMAYLGYLLQDPLYWSFQRGANSGNPNMTVSRTVNIGLIGCVLLDHPEGPAWAQNTIDWIKYWLENTVDEDGVWVESSHYARYAVSTMTLMAIAARNCKLHDFFEDPVFKRMILYYVKSMTPPDPLRRVNSHRLARFRLGAPAVRSNPTYGRGTRGDTWPTAGLVARTTATSDPAFSRIMQWSWQQCGYVDWFTGKTASQSTLYLNPYIPAQAPDWQSAFFTNRGYLLRSHVGTAQENYLYFITQYYRSSDGEIWPSNTGAIVKWFASGVPIGGSFVRMYKQSHQLLENRVMLATNWDPKVGKSAPSGYVTETTHHARAFLPRADFVHTQFRVPQIKEHIMKIDPKAPAFPKRDKEGEVPLLWNRQLILSKPVTPQGQNYMIIRDTVDCDEPTQWHFWTLSDGIVPAGTADRDAATLGPKVVPLRELAGNRLTALGQFGVDCEYYIASPTNTPRYTLRWGGKQSGYGLRGNYPEYQDLMHLQLPGKGTYFICMYPKTPDQVAPRFETLGGGTVIRIQAPGLDDYCFLSSTERPVSAGDAAFSGTSASVQNRADGLTLMLGAPGEVSYNAYSLHAPSPVAITIAPGMATIRRDAAVDGLEVSCVLPGAQELTATSDGLSVEQQAGKPGHFVVKLAPGAAGGDLLIKRATP